jgi:hypothetical protein
MYGEQQRTSATSYSTNDDHQLVLSLHNLTQATLNTEPAVSFENTGNHLPYYAVPSSKRSKFKQCIKLFPSEM